MRGIRAPQEQELSGNTAAETQYCQQVLAKLYQEGYTIKTSFAMGNTSTSTVVLTEDK